MTQPKPKRIDRRKNRTCVRLNEKEAGKIEKMMAKTEKSAQQLMKEALLPLYEELTTPRFNSEQAETLLSQLKEVGNALNELARKFNAGEITHDWEKRLAPFATAFSLFRLKLDGKIALDYPLMSQSVLANP